jgi:lysozyme
MSEFSNIALTLIAPFEGLAKVKSDGLVYPYLDTMANPPRWTQGYGETLGIEASSPPWTKEQSLGQLRIRIDQFGERVAMLAPSLRLHPARHAAVVSWAYNCGLGAFQHSRLRKAILASDWVSAKQLILKPDTAGGVVYRGLTRRRIAESLLM